MFTYFFRHFFIKNEEIHSLFYFRLKTSAPTLLAAELFEKRNFFQAGIILSFFNIIRWKRFWFVHYHMYNKVITTEYRYLFWRKIFPMFVSNFDTLNSSSSFLRRSELTLQRANAHMAITVKLETVQISLRSIKTRLFIQATASTCRSGWARTFHVINVINFPVWIFVYIIIIILLLKCAFRFKTEDGNISE